MALRKKRKIPALGNSGSVSNKTGRIPVKPTKNTCTTPIKLDEKRKLKKYKKTGGKPRPAIKRIATGQRLHGMSILRRRGKATKEATTDASDDSDTQRNSAIGRERGAFLYRSGTALTNSSSKSMSINGPH